MKTKTRTNHSKLPSPFGRLDGSRPRKVHKKKHKDHMSKDEYIALVNEYQDSDDPVRKKEIATRVVLGLEHLNLKICRAMVRKWPGSTLDEAVQAGRYGIVRALTAWDRKKSKKVGAGFLTYVYYWIYSEARRFMMSERRGDIVLPRNKVSEACEKDLPKSYESYDMLYSDDQAESISVGERMSFKSGIFSESKPALLSADLRKISEDVLTERENSIIWRVMDGETFQEISQSYGTSKQRIQRIKDAALYKLKKRIKLLHPELVHAVP